MTAAALTVASVGDHCRSSTDLLWELKGLWSICHAEPPSRGSHTWMFFLQSPLTRRPGNTTGATLNLNKATFATLNQEKQTFFHFLSVPFMLCYKQILFGVLEKSNKEAVFPQPIIFFRFYLKKDLSSFARLDVVLLWAPNDKKDDLHWGGRSISTKIYMDMMCKHYISFSFLDFTD